jgi:4-amino-4-deoxy-L-arabinose transferase-like glycosyltransferase
VDWAGDAPGYVGTECPIQPFIAALTYRLIGVHDWIGRAGTVLVFAFSLPFFYLLVRRTFGQTAAFWSLLFYSFAPLNIIAARSFMPDSPSLGLSLAGLYFFLRALEEDEWKYWIAASMFTALALLVKLPSAVIGAPLLYLAWRRYRTTLLKQGKLWAFSAVVLVPSAVWYLHAHRIAEVYYPFHFFGGGGIAIKGLAWYWDIIVQTATSSLTTSLFVIAAVGLFIAPRTGDGRLFHWWLAAMALFIFVVGRGNHHQWYRLPLVPITAAFAGYAVSLGIERLSPHPRAAVVAVAILIAIFGSESIKYTRPFYIP